MEEIRNYNCDGMCCQKTCSERYTHFQNLTLYGVNIHLAFCKKHAEEFEDGFWAEKSGDKNNE